MGVDNILEIYDNGTIESTARQILDLDELKEHIECYLENSPAISADLLHADVSEWASESEIDEALIQLMVENRIVYHGPEDFYSID